MKLMLGLIATVFVACLVGGCATRAGEAPKVGQSNVAPAVGNFNDRMKNLAEQLEKNRDTNSYSGTYIVASFANLDKLDDTTSIGRLISENLIHGLQTYKWQILEVRLTKGVDINSAGEFFLSRDASKLKDEYKISGVVTGTYSVAEGNITINARVIDINTGIVISSGQTYIPQRWLSDASLPEDSAGKPMKIVRDGIK